MKLVIIWILDHTVCGDSQYILKKTIFDSIWKVLLYILFPDKHSYKPPMAITPVRSGKGVFVLFHIFHLYLFKIFFYWMLNDKQNFFMHVTGLQQ